jgi:outer membrane protein OmpU
MVSMVAAPASAAEKIKLELGGYMYQFFGGVGTINNGEGGVYGGKARDGFGQDSKTRITVGGKTTLDNGITVGASVQFRSQTLDGDKTNDNNAKEQFAYLSGDFGALYAGERNGVFDKFAVRAPTVTYRNGNDTQKWLKTASGQFNSGSYMPTQETTIDDGAARVTYVTPKFFDALSAGVSYAPNAGLFSNYGTRVREGRRGSNQVQAGLALDTKAGDVGIKGDASVATSLDGVERVGYRAGLALSYANFTFGGSYMGTSADRSERGTKGVPTLLGQSHNVTSATSHAAGNNHFFEENIWEVGLSYKEGPYGASLTYTQSAADRNEAKTAGGGESATVQLGGSYKLGAGVTAVGQVFYAENDTKQMNATQTYRSGVGALSGLILEF